MNRLPSPRTIIFVLSLSLATLALSNGSVFAADPKRLAQLRETNKCERCDLRGADLSFAKLSGAGLRGADLLGGSMANLSAANLSAADLFGANLNKASEDARRPPGPSSSKIGH